MELVDCLILDDLVDASLAEKEANPTVVAMAAKANVSVDRATKLWKKAGELASEKFDTESKDWWAYKIGVFKRMLGVAESVHFVCDLSEAVSEEAAKRVLDPGKHVLIDNVWWRVKSRSVDDNEVVLEVSSFAVKDGVKYQTKKMTFTDLVGAINKGEIGAKIDGKQYGPEQDREKRDALRRKHGRSAAPGMRDYREKAEQKAEDVVAIAVGAAMVEGTSKWGGGPAGTETVHALRTLSAFPEKADDGKAFVVRWADGRAVTAFETKKALLAWANKTHKSLMDTEDLPIAIVSIKHAKPEINGKRIEVRERVGNVSEALAVLAWDHEPASVLSAFHSAYAAATEQGLPVAIAEAYALAAAESLRFASGVYRGRIVEGNAAAFLDRFGTPVGKSERDRVSWMASKSGVAFDALFDARSKAHARGLSHIDADLFAMRVANRTLVEGPDFIDEVSSREDALMQFVMTTDKRVDEFEGWLCREYPALARAPEPLHESVPDQIFNVPAALAEDVASLDYPNLLRLSLQATEGGRWAKQSVARVRGPRLADRRVAWDAVSDSLPERFEVPAAVRSVVRSALMLQKQHGIPMRECDRRTARELTRKSAPLRTVQRMAATRDVPVAETDEKGVPTAPYLAFLLRGGNVGYRWARMILSAAP